MCYAEPGPRCSGHASKELGKAAKAHYENPTDANYAKLKEAEMAYYATPAGLDELEQKYTQTKDPLVADLLAERSSFRESQFEAMKNVAGGTRQKISHGPGGH